MSAVTFDGIGRKRDRALVTALLESVAANGGQLTEDACLAALNSAHQTQYRDAAAARRTIERKLRNPDIRKALADVYQSVGDFSIADAIVKHVEHINGVEYDKVVRRKDGHDWVEAVERVHDKPSYAALKDFLSMTLPMPAKKLAIDVTAHAGRSMLESVPAIEPRAIGPAKVEPVVTDAVVELVDDEDDADG